jgi:hypothetical protein
MSLESEIKECENRQMSIHEGLKEATKQGYSLKFYNVSKFNTIEIYPNKVLLRGFTLEHAYDYFWNIPFEYKLSNECSLDSLRLVYFNETKFIVYTYVEGDLIVEIYKTLTDYQEGISKTKSWYNDNE